MTSNILIDSSSSQRRWIEIALEYLPQDVKADEKCSLSIIALGDMGACRLPPSYREREVIFLSDWLFPPPGVSEADDAGIFFITTVLHEIAHAFCRHKSPSLDALSSDQIQSQEDEADKIAVTWFNSYIDEANNQYLEKIEETRLRELVEQFAVLYNMFEKSKESWHQKINT